MADDGSPSEGNAAGTEAADMRNADRAAAAAAAESTAEAAAADAVEPTTAAVDAATSAAAASATATASSSSTTGSQRRSRDQCSADHGHCDERGQFFMSHVLLLGNVAPSCPIVDLAA